MCHIARRHTAESIVVAQHTLGLDVRFGTGDDGATLGLSTTTTAFPRETIHVETPPFTFKFRPPLGIAWTDATSGIIHELGLIATTVPSPGEVAFRQRSLIGAGVMMSPRDRGVVIGYSSKTYVEAPPDKSAAYTVRYESDKPMQTLCQRYEGDN